ncbi:P-loop containing nucleoside triphosphate hydrolase protein [Earliella scabrosa]|nr:P-loop containing nucleoside triphosphate hydrolase protein [Earliella scabrosa]
MSSGPTSFVWSSPQGRQLARQILQNTLPYDPHDYQLEGVCKVLDGSDLLAMIATGRGKTGFFIMYMLLQLALAKKPDLCDPPWSQTPKDPGMLVVCPTIGLEEEMAIVFDRHKLKTLVINSRTLEAARSKRPSLWQAAETSYAMVILSPELLTNGAFETLLQSRTFQDRICALAIDEVHLLNSWGAGFRKPFQQLGFARARMRGGVRLIGTSASILAGHARKNICDLLGLHPGRYYWLQRSNIRPELRLLFRPLSHGLGGWSFPDFRWVLEGRRKTVFYCRTIALSFRLFCYLWQLCPASEHPDIRIRMYNSLNWPQYNERTRELMRNDQRAQVIIATASFMVGVDLPNIADVILTQEPADADEWVQWGGRAGRDRSVVSDARVLTYVTKKAPEKARALLNSQAPEGAGNVRPPSSKKTTHASMDITMAKILTATCKISIQNELYDNPSHEHLCTCRTCTAQPPPALSLPCTCSGCSPETPMADTPPAKKHDTNPVPRRQRLTRVMRKHGMECLERLREEIYDGLEHSARTRSLPPSAFLPSTVITAILDRFALLKTVDDLRALLDGRTHVLPHVEVLWKALQSLRVDFDAIRAKAKEERRLRDAAKRALNDMLEAADEDEMEDESESDEEELRQILASVRQRLGSTSTTEAAQATAHGGHEHLPSVNESEASPRADNGAVIKNISGQALSMVLGHQDNGNMNVEPVHKQGGIMASVPETSLIQSGLGYAMHVFGVNLPANPPKGSHKRTLGNDAGGNASKRRRKAPGKENIVP